MALIGKLPIASTGSWIYAIISRHLSIGYCVDEKLSIA